MNWYERKMLVAFQRMSILKYMQDINNDKYQFGQFENI